MRKGSFVVWIGLLLILAFFMARFANGINASNQSCGASFMLIYNANKITNTKENNTVAKSYSHIEVTSTLGDVVEHPAFNGFGQFILPLDRGYYDKKMPLKQVGSLLPYHGNVSPAAVVDTINTLIDKVSAGETIFYDFYTQQQKKYDFAKRSTGLFFFRGKPGAPFAIVCPGGGFSYVGSVHEGFPHAIELSNKGYNSFVIQYRVGGEKMACEDLAAAISYIFENADLLEVETEGYSVWGSSAGARMAARLGSYGTAGYSDNDLPKPGTVVMAYTGHTDYTKNDPPTFMVIGDRDGIASPATMERRANAMRNAGIDVEFHKYQNVGHGFGFGTGTSAEGWLDAATSFWESHISECRKK